jgi:hypothetical protein
VADFIQLFMEATAGTGSPEAFRQWAAISAVGAACERRVWVRTKSRLAFPNLYTFLVAPPGVGKQVILDLRTIVRGLPDRTMRLGSDSMTSASMVDELAAAKTSIAPRGVAPLEYHSMFIAAEEAQVFLPEYDGRVLGTLNSIYNNPGDHTESRRHGKPPSITIPNPQLNLLMGVQPGWMAGTFPDLAWSTGLMSRVIMVYVEDQPLVDIFGTEDDEPIGADSIRRGLISITKQYGEMTWEPAARERIRGWHLAGAEPKPTHSKLVYYCNRRPLHLTKLALISAVARGQTSVIQLLDIERAMGWLLSAERFMPDIFRAMTGRNDMAVVEELHIFALSCWTVNGHKGVHENTLIEKLMNYVPVDRAEKILLMAEKAGYLTREAGSSLYKPRPRFTTESER